MTSDLLILPVAILTFVVVCQGIALLHTNFQLRTGWRREKAYQKIIDDLNAAHARHCAALNGAFSGGERRATPNRSDQPGDAADMVRAAATEGGRG